MKKKLIAIGLAVALLGVSAVSGTLAYLTDTDKATNVFTVGNVEVTLTDEVSVRKFNADGDDISSEKLETIDDTYTFKNIVPTNYIKRPIIVKNDSKNADAFVRVAVVMNNVGAIKKTINSNVIKGAVEKIFDSWNIDKDLIITKTNPMLAVDTYFAGGNNNNQFDPTANYNIVGNDEVLYVYYIKLSVNEEVTLSKGLMADKDMDTEELAMFDGLKIEVYADAIQAEGFDENESDPETIAKNAFAALELAHPLKALRAPKAEVEMLEENEVRELLCDDNGVPSIDGLNDAFVYGLTFNATETPEEAASGDYATWNADFVVSLSKEIVNTDEQEDLYLWGEYGPFTADRWHFGAVDTIGNNIPANEYYRLLESYPLYWPYQDIVEIVNEFKCGVVIPKDTNMEVGTVITVQLCLYETDAVTGNAQKGNEVVPENRIVIGTYTYTYEG